MRRRRVRRRVTRVAADLDISDQTIYAWRRQELIDTGQMPGTTSTENAEPWTTPCANDALSPA